MMKQTLLAQNKQSALSIQQSQNLTTEDTEKIRGQIFSVLSSFSLSGLCGEQLALPLLLILPWSANQKSKIKNQQLLG
ncbi:MAG TPA: hypothetical protein VJA94_03935 [Candidatus Angelobacter sp.]